GIGITVGAHYKGKIIDVNNGLDGDGPMSPQRSGGLPVGQLIELCFSGDFTKEEMIRKVRSNGGLKAYLGTSDALEVEEMINNGDKKAELIYKALAYQVSKEIASMSAVLMGEVDGIIITGGLSQSQLIIDEISKRITHLGEITVSPGENEMKALANNGYLVLRDEIEVKEYK
ncbi:MAG: butyrate kinase, partial [Bacteroidales bacterium]